MDVIIMSIIAGICGTGFGGILTAVLGSRTDKTISSFLSFASGVMISIVFFELIPQATQYANTTIAVLGLIIGVVMVLLLNQIIDKVSNSRHKATKLHETYEEFFHENEMITRTRNLFRSGVLMFFVIGLHSIPEGLAIGAAGNHDIALGGTLALMIGIHNIPEGMAISAPLISGGLRKWKAISLTVLAGTPIVLGTLIGVWTGGISDAALSLSFSIAGGAMLYAVFGEILPQSINISKDRIPMIVLLVGIIIGLLLTKI
ncbi:MAG: ZIP family metal transporter [Dehalococcoidia bacterium]|nr:ZIP family metal transporter [Dehalococcoidia bacterium]